MTDPLLQQLRRLSANAPLELSSFTSPSFNPSVYLRDSLGFKPESASSLTFDDCLTGLEGIKRNLLNTKEQVLIDLQKLVSNKDNGDLILDAALRWKDLEQRSYEFSTLTTRYNDLMTRDEQLVSQLESKVAAALPLITIHKQGSPLDRIQVTGKLNLDLIKTDWLVHEGDGDLFDPNIAPIIQQSVQLAKLLDPKTQTLIKYGKVSELTGTLETLKRRSLYLLLLSDALLLLCKVKKRPGQQTRMNQLSPPPATASTSSLMSSPSSNTNPSLVTSSQSYVICKYLPFRCTTLYNIDDLPSKGITQCLKLKSITDEQLGTKAESVLLHIGAEKDTWMSIIRDAIESYKLTNVHAGNETRSNIDENKKLQLGSLTQFQKDRLDELFEELALNRDLGAYDLCLDVLDKIDYIITECHPSKDRKRGPDDNNVDSFDLFDPFLIDDDLELKFVLQQRNLLVETLINYLKLEIEQSISEARLIGLVRALNTLGHIVEAREAFFKSRSLLIKATQCTVMRRTNQQTRQDLTLRTEELIKETARLYKNTFIIKAIRDDETEVEKKEAQLENWATLERAFLKQILFPEKMSIE